MGERQIIFVCGVGRSGTTALAELLNGHPDVCVGIERYKYLLMRRQPVSIDLFAKDRFFDIRPEDTNIVPGSGTPAMVKLGRMFKAMPAKWDRAKIVGDKIPHLFSVLPHVLGSFPGCKIIYILRDVRGVASSWNARADNPGDSWSADAGFERAVKAWNQANKIMLRQKRATPDQVLIVSYERALSGHLPELRRLLEFLDLRPRPSFLLAWARLALQYHLLALRRKPAVKPGQDEFIARHADLGKSRKLLAE